MTDRTRVVNCRREPFDIFIGRPGPWGNPFQIGALCSRSQAIERFREWIQTQPQMLLDAESLRGLRLGCFCKPFACHGDVLVDLLHPNTGPFWKQGDLI